MKWHKGPPPEIGWWPASVQRDKEVIRWWDGKCWSFPLSPTDSKHTAGRFAKTKVDKTTYIEWTDRWWL